MKKEKELKTVYTMINMYCHKKHKTKKKDLCNDCNNLYSFVEMKRNKCPFGDDKGFCTNCKIHCYKSNILMREKIREVMRYSGPRLMFKHPIMYFNNLFETIKNKRQNKRIERNKNDR